MFGKCPQPGHLLPFGLFARSISGPVRSVGAYGPSGSRATIPLLGPTATHDEYVAERRPPTRATLTEAAVALQKLLDAVEAGEVDNSTPHDIALLRRLQGTLAGWNEALGKAPEDDDHTG
jgi:hypothetical protein